MSASARPGEYTLSFTDNEEVSPWAPSVPVPIHELLGRTSIGISELFGHAFRNIPLDFVAYRMQIGNCLDLLEQLPDSTLQVYGPSEGSYYVCLPQGDK